MSKPPVCHAKQPPTRRAAQDRCCPPFWNAQLGRLRTPLVAGKRAKHMLEGLTCQLPGRSRWVTGCAAAGKKLRPRVPQACAIMACRAKDETYQHGMCAHGKCATAAHH